MGSFFLSLSVSLSLFLRFTIRTLGIFFSDSVTDDGCECYIHTCEFLPIPNTIFSFLLLLLFRSLQWRTTKYSLSWVFHSFRFQYRSIASTGKVSWSCNKFCIRKISNSLIDVYDRYKRSHFQIRNAIDIVLFMLKIKLKFNLFRLFFFCFFVCCRDNYVIGLTLAYTSRRLLHLM